MEEPRFRVKACGVILIRHLHFCAELNEVLDRAPFGGPRIGCRHDAQLSTARNKSLELVGDQSQPTPTDERDDKIDSVGRIDFGRKYGADPRLSSCVNQEIT